MNSRGRRLDRLYRTLTVPQRLSLLLTSWKQGRKPDKAIWSTMASEDRADFDRRIGLLRAANEHAPYIHLLWSRVAGLDAKFELVSTRRRLGDDIRALGGYIRATTREPVTASAFRQIERDRRGQLVPVHDLVEIAVEYYSGWSDADCREDAGERVLSAEAWTRACSETERDLIELFRVGTLEGADLDTGVHISAGSFYDWLGEPIPVLSESGCPYEVVPDRQAKDIALKQHARRLVEELFTTAPGRGELPLELEGPWPDVASAETAHALLERMDILALRDGIQRRWRELRCLEIVLAELAAKELNGEDPLPVETRKVLRQVRRHLSALHEEVQSYCGDFALPNPATEDLALCQKLMERSAAR